MVNHFEVEDMDESIVATNLKKEPYNVSSGSSSAADLNADLEENQNNVEIKFAELGQYVQNKQEKYRKVKNEVKEKDRVIEELKKENEEL